MFRSLSLVALSALLALGTGCSSKSSGGSAPATTTAAATAGFGVVSSSPLNGEQDFRVDAALVVTFSEDLDPASLVSGAVELMNDQGPVAATVQATTPRVLEVRPQALLDPHTNHLLRVTAAVKSTSGAALAQDVLIRFTTGMPRVPVTTSGGSAGPATPGPYVAGAASIDATPPIGVPLAGYGGGDRRHTPLPDLNPFNFYTFLNPSVGVHDPIHARALVIGNGVERVCMVTLDAIATDAEVVEVAWRKAAARGFSVPLEKVMVSSSHSHSGPGTVSHRFFWEIVAADLFVDSVFQGFTDKVAEAMVQAELNLGPARIGVASTQVTNATTNRRAGDSPDLNSDSIDPEMLVIRVDRPDGTPVATLWNFAIHGTMFGTSNFHYSADVMGSACLKLEAAGAGVALFVNGCEGDIKPTGSWDTTGRILADAALAARQSATTEAQGRLQTTHEIVDMGTPTLDASVSRIGGANNQMVQGWMIALQNFGIGLGAGIVLPRGWIEHEFRFQAIRLGDTVVASFPGEPIHAIGLALKADAKALGFRHVLAAGLSNGHGSYFTTEKEYWYGGYEALASMFGPDNGKKLLDAAMRQVTKLQ